MTINNFARRASASHRAIFAGIVVAAAAACSNNDATTAPGNGLSFTSSPCSITGTLQLASGQTARADCSNGGTTVQVAGNGASYLVVAQFAASLVPDQFVSYRLSAGTAVSASVASRFPRASASRIAAPPRVLDGKLPAIRPGAKQLSFTRALRARARQKLSSGAWSSGVHTRISAANRSIISANGSTVSRNQVPPLGSLRQFKVTNIDGTGFTTATSTLAYIGNDVLVYIDTLAPANGFTPTQLQAFGVLFDQTLYGIDTAAFGGPSDIDQNGHVIMLMSPAVNKLTTASECQTQGFVAGFFNEEDLSGGANDPNSNNGEIFYSIVPDTTGTFSCIHGVGEVGQSVPATFVHELQHLISYSQHVVIHNGQPEYGWLDEGLSIVAEELGSVYYEQRCTSTGPSCRQDPSQIFPDSSQGFVSGFLYDSYQYALLPDTASVTLHTDSDDGFSWRGGDWLLMRWLGDQMGSGFYKKLDQSTFTGVANIEAQTGKSFPSMFADFGLALYTDSLPGLPRTTAPAADRFVSRNIRQLWARESFTSGGTLPLSYPVQVFPITADTSIAIMDPGTMSYFRLDTPANVATVSMQFAGPGGVALPASVKPQLMIFRLPPGQ